MPQFITPVPGRLTQPFIPGIHYGVDIGATDHSTVVASEAGRVTFEGIWGDGGNTIIITGNDGWKTYYCHLAKFLVNMGASVMQGQAIAQSGGALGEPGAGNATGAHLHFEIHNPQGVAVNPQQYISVGGAALEVMPINTNGKTTNFDWHTLIPYVTLGILGSPSARKVVPGATGAATAVDTATSTAAGAGKAIGFLTNPGSWKRIGLFAAGSIILIIVAIKLFEQTDIGQSAVGAAKSAGKDAAKAAILA